MGSSLLVSTLPWKSRGLAASMSGMLLGAAAVCDAGAVGGGGVVVVVVASTGFVSASVWAEVASGVAGPGSVLMSSAGAGGAAGCGVAVVTSGGLTLAPTAPSSMALESIAGSAAAGSTAILPIW